METDCLAAVSHVVLQSATVRPSDDVMSDLLAWIS